MLEKSEKECTICLQISTNDLGELKCKHSFCFDCIEDWSRHENSCPLCKSRFNYIDRIQQVLSKNKSANSKQKKTRVRIKKKSQGDDPDFQYVTGDRDNFITHLSLYISSIVGRARRESALFRDNVGSSANNPIEIEEQHSSSRANNSSSASSSTVPIDLTADDDNTSALSRSTGIIDSELYSSRIYPIEYERWEDDEDTDDGIDDEGDDNEEEEEEEGRYNYESEDSNLQSWCSNCRVFHNTRSAMDINSPEFCEEFYGAMLDAEAERCTLLELCELRALASSSSSSSTANTISSSSLPFSNASNSRRSDAANSSRNASLRSRRATVDRTLTVTSSSSTSSKSNVQTIGKKQKRKRTKKDSNNSSSSYEPREEDYDVVVDDDDDDDNNEGNSNRRNKASKYNTRSNRQSTNAMSSSDNNNNDDVFLLVGDTTNSNTPSANTSPTVSRATRSRRRGIVINRAGLDLTNSYPDERRSTSSSSNNCSTGNCSPVVSDCSEGTTINRASTSSSSTATTTLAEDNIISTSDSTSTSVEAPLKRRKRNRD